MYMRLCACVCVCRVCRIPYVCAGERVLAWRVRTGRRRSRKKKVRTVYLLTTQDGKNGTHAERAPLPSLLNMQIELRKCCNHPYLIHGVEQSVTNGMSAEEAREAMLSASGKLILLDSEEEWEAALEVSKSAGMALYADYTASWCHNCHELKPRIEALAAAHQATTLFVEIDVDELEDLAYEQGAAALPMQEVYINGVQVARSTGNFPDKLEPLLLDALKKSS